MIAFVVFVRGIRNMGEEFYLYSLSAGAGHVQSQVRTCAIVGVFCFNYYITGKIKRNQVKLNDASMAPHKDFATSLRQSCINDL